MRRFNCFLLALVAIWVMPQAVLAGLPDVQRGEAAGLSFWLIEQPSLPIIEMQIVFRGAGYSSDPEAQQGRAALAAAMLSEGAGSRDSEAFAKALEERAIELGVHLGRDHLSVTLKTLSEHRLEAFELLADMLRFARFDEVAMEKRKRQMTIQRTRQLESPSYLAARAFAQSAYGEHPYAQEELGSEASVSALKVADLRAYYERYLAKDAMVISLAGDVTPQEAQKLLSAYLGEMRPTTQSERHLENVSAYEVFDVELSKSLPQSLILFAAPALSRRDADFYAAYVLNHILGGGALSSRLAVELREKRGLTYGVSTSLESGLYADRWLGSFATKNATAEEAVEAVRGVLHAVSETGVSEEELLAAKDYITGSFPLQLDGNGALTSYLTIMQLYDLGTDYLQQRNAYFEAVTLEQVNRLARTYLAPEAWSWVKILGKETP